MQIDLLDQELIKGLARFADADPERDVVAELAAYLGVDLLAAAAMLAAAPVSVAEQQASTAEETERFYAESPTYYLDLLRTPLRLRHLWGRTQITLSLAQKVGARRYLDFGAGVGRDCLCFARLGFAVTHADLPGPEMRFATWRYQQRSLNVQTVDARSLPDERYEVISCYDVLEHVADPIGTLGQLATHLVLGGYLALAVDLYNFQPPHLEKNALYGPIYHDLLEASGLRLCMGNHPLIDAVQAGLRIYQRQTPADATPSVEWRSLAPLLYTQAAERLMRQRQQITDELALIRATQKRVIVDATLAGWP